MIHGGFRISKLWQSPISPPFNFPYRLLIKFEFSSLFQAKGLNTLDEESDEFFPWLQRKAGTKISSVLSIGKSPYGRSLFASEKIRSGDCILKVPYSLHITTDSLLPKIKALLSDQIGIISKLAIVLLVEQKMDQIFWSEYELDMIRQSSVYQETLNQKAKIEKDFAAVVPALQQLPDLESITLQDFMCAYFSVTSRAWESSKGLSLIPFTDFMNHDGISKSIVLFDDDKMLSEVIADRNYAPGEEVIISYGKLPNASLLLDFGFTLPDNIHDQVQIQLNIPYDILREKKLELVQHHTPKIKDSSGRKCSEDTFVIKEVRSPQGKGKGLPQALHAFARVVCCNSPPELNDLVMEAERIDGRLARCPLKDSRREFKAHQMLLSHITRSMQKYDASIKSLALFNFPSMSNTFALRRQMAHNLLTGELRVLSYASAWLDNYCAILKSTINCSSH